MHDHLRNDRNASVIAYLDASTTHAATGDIEIRCEQVRTYYMRQLSLKLLLDHQTRKMSPSSNIPGGPKSNPPLPSIVLKPANEMRFFVKVTNTHYHLTFNILGVT